MDRRAGRVAPVSRLSRYSLAADVEVQELGAGGGAVAVDMANGTTFTLNASALEVLGHFRAGLGFDEVVESLVAHHDVDRATAETETRALTDRLLAHRLIVADRPP